MAYPVLVVEHDRIGCGQVDSDTGSPGTQEEQAWCVHCVSAPLESLHLRLSVRYRGRTVNPTQSPPFIFRCPIFDDVQHHFELAEYKHLVSASEEFIEKALQDHHLPTRVNELIVDDILGSVVIDRPIEEERMRTNFPELHDNVLQAEIVDLLYCKSRVRMRRKRLAVLLALRFVGKFCTKFNGRLITPCVFVPITK